MRTGPTNTLVDVAGFRVGHATRDEPGWLTGTTVVLPPDGGCVAGVDVRGAAPGTRETDLLDPRNLVDRVNAVVLSGGSALGLASVDGVVQGLLEDGIGWPMGAPGQVVPIVPAAVVFDLGRGGDWRHHPGFRDGQAAYADARDSGARPVPLGAVGGGTGAKVGGFKGGVGSASCVLDDGVTVAALCVVNAIGSAVDETTGELWGARHELDDELAGLMPPSAPEVAAARTVAAGLPERFGGMPGMATTIGVVATDARLSKVQCHKMAGVAHDGLARALKPVHTYFDGDTLFALASGGHERELSLPELALVQEAGADCVTRAVMHAVLAADSVDRRADGGAAWRSYRAAFPSAYG